MFKTTVTSVKDQLTV